MPLVRREEPRNCDRHGAYTSTVTTSVFEASILDNEKRLEHTWESSCPACEEERTKKVREEEEAREERKRLERIGSNRRASGIPGRFAHCGFDNYQAETPPQKEAFLACRTFAENFDVVCKSGNWLTLSGNPGCGKTHLACAIANHLLNSERKIIYTQAIELVRAIRDTWRRDSRESETDVVNRFRAVDLLILDEVGVSFGSDAEKTQLFDVLDGRYRSLKPTLIITNLNGNELKAAIGPRMYDRLTEAGSGLVLFDWNSYRRNRPITPADSERSPETVVC
jgi:DNA replication protein DnaC